MKHHSPKFEDLIRKAFHQEADPKFQQQLGQMLLQKSSNYKDSNFWNFLPNFVAMHKFPFFASISSFLIISIIMTFAWSSQTNTANAQIILAQISDIYHEDAKKEGIFQQKLLIENFGTSPTEKILQEIWYDNIGDYLQIEKNYENKEILTINMTKGDKSYILSPSVNEYSPEERALLGPQYYCVDYYEDEKNSYETVLAISKENPQYTRLTGAGGSIPATGTRDSEEELMQDLEQLKDARTDAETMEKLLEKLKNSKKIKFSEVTEKNIKYYVFTIDEGLEYYFNSNTFRLEKQKNNYKDEKQTITFLENNFLTDLDGKEIFNPEKYQLIRAGSFEAGFPYYIKKINNNKIKTGCYDGETGQRLNDEEAKTLWEKVSPEVIKDFENLKKQIRGERKSSINEQVSTVEPFITPDMVEEKFIFPTIGDISQSFTFNHYGIDIARSQNDESKDINPAVWSAASGKVIKVVTGCSEVSPGCGDGYGNYIILQHSDGFETLYAHLGTMNVKVNDALKQSQTLGTMGRSGNVSGKTGNHLHFEVHKNGEKLNPLLYINLKNKQQ